MFPTNISALTPMQSDDLFLRQSCFSRERGQNEAINVQINYDFFSNGITEKHLLMGMCYISASAVT